MPTCYWSSEGTGAREHCVWGSRRCAYRQPWV